MIARLSGALDNYYKGGCKYNTKRKWLSGLAVGLGWRFSHSIHTHLYKRHWTETKTTVDRSTDCVLWGGWSEGEACDGGASFSFRA